jgi:hypothetical protein
MNTNVEKGVVGVAFFGGAGEMREGCRAFDWAATPLGPVESWPANIRPAAVRRRELLSRR